MGQHQVYGHLLPSAGSPLRFIAQHTHDSFTCVHTCMHFRSATERGKLAPAEWQRRCYKTLRRVRLSKHSTYNRRSKAGCVCACVCAQQHRGTIYTPKLHSTQITSQILSEVERKERAIPTAVLISVWCVTCYLQYFYLNEHVWIFHPLSSFHYHVIIIFLSLLS